MHVESMSSPFFGASPNDIPVLDRETTVYQNNSLCAEKDDVDDGPPTLTRAPVICFSTFPDPKFRETQDASSLLDNDTERCDEETPVIKTTKMRKTFCIDDILARVYPEEKVETPTIFSGKRVIEECQIHDQSTNLENNHKKNTDTKEANSDKMDGIPKLEKQISLQESQNKLATTSLKEQSLKSETSANDITTCVDGAEILPAEMDIWSPLTPSLDPELLKRFEAEDTPRRVLRASTIAVTKSSLARKEFAHKNQKRRADNKGVKQPKRKMNRKSKETLATKRYDTPIEVKITEEAALCTPSSSGVSSMSSTSSNGSGKSRGQKKLQHKIISNWRPVTAGEKHYVYNSNDNAPVKRLCFSAVQHIKEPETIRLHDAVIVNSEDGSRNIGKVARIFLDDGTGSLMATVFWYYTNEQVEIDKKNIDPPIASRELLASRHIDMIPIDTIQEVVYVLTVNEYCRYVAENKTDALPREQRPRIENEVWPRAENTYYRRSCLPCEDSQLDLVYFCRRIYDFKQKRIIANRRAIPKKVVSNKKIISGRRGHRHRCCKTVD